MFTPAQMFESFWLIRRLLRLKVGGALLDFT